MLHFGQGNDLSGLPIVSCLWSRCNLDRHSGSKIINVNFEIVILQMAMAGVGLGFSRTSVYCSLAICRPPRHSNHTVDGLFVPSALRLQTFDFTSTEHSFYNSNETHRTVVARFTFRISYPGFVEICVATTFLTKRDELLSRFRAMQSLDGVCTSRPVWSLDRMLPACSANGGRKKASLL